jgi:DNA-binding FadR family transcriptional regulator
MEISRTFGSFKRKVLTFQAYVQRIEPSILADTFEGIVKLEHISLQDLMEARVALELAALPIIMERIQEEDLDALEENFKEVQENLEKGIRGKKNLAFHVILLRASHNQLLSKIGEAMLDLMGKLLEQVDYSPERSKAMLKEHKELIKLLKQKDYERFREKLERHIINSVNFSRYR